MRTLIALLLVAASPSAAAKCTVQSYLLSGSVVDAHGAPVSGAMVGVAWVKWGAPQGPAIAVTSSEGRYSIPIHFDTWSGTSEWGDDCDAGLGQVSVSAYTSTKYALPETVAVGEQRRVVAPVLQVSQDTQESLGR